MENCIEITNLFHKYFIKINSMGRIKYNSCAIEKQILDINKFPVIIRDVI